jgi:regulator of replication initiation timing
MSKELEQQIAFLKKENERLKAQAKGVEILLQQNTALEGEVDRLCRELDDTTKGVVKRG